MCSNPSYSSQSYYKAGGSVGSETLKVNDHRQGTHSNCIPPCFICLTANYPCANLHDLWLYHTQNWLGRPESLSSFKKNFWQQILKYLLPLESGTYNLSKPNSLCFGKLSKFRVFCHFLCFPCAAGTLQQWWVTWCNNREFFYSTNHDPVPGALGPLPNTIPCPVASGRTSQVYICLQGPEGGQRSAQVTGVRRQPPVDLRCLPLSDHVATSWEGHKTLHICMCAIGTIWGMHIRG